MTGYLFVPETDDGILLRRLGRRHDPEDETHRDRDAERHHDRERGDDRVDVRDALDRRREDDADDDADDAAREADHDGFTEELREAVPLRRPHRPADADL